MSGAELLQRGRDGVRRQMWRRYRHAPSMHPACRWLPERRFEATLPDHAVDTVPPAAQAAVIRCADQVLDGHFPLLGLWRHDLHHPDWFRDPVTGRRAPQETYAFDVRYRRESVTGNVKQIWELSRMQHVTVLATAFALSGQARYAEEAARQLRWWWSANPPLTGVNWTNGIEVGIRLIAWVWVRRLLHGWSNVGELFEENADALLQVWWHQRFLAAFPSRGTSANNHAIAEAAGQLVAALAFPWFQESERWASEASARLPYELDRNTFASGVNRELASGYHTLVAELAVVAGAEGDLVGHPLPDRTWALVCSMVDAAAAMLDETLQGPRQGDSDDSRALLLDPPDRNPWSTLLACGRAVFGACGWWPPCSDDVSSTLWAALIRPRSPGDRPARRPTHFADAGLTFLRTAGGGQPEIWCRCDGGPHGFGPIAAHAHADALSIEVRHGGVAVLTDPGTYCYHYQQVWREYFRSTLAHNTVEIDGVSQSCAGGPFLWSTQAPASVTDLVVDPDGGAVAWDAVHDGYAALSDPARHRRYVRMDPGTRRIEIIDRVISTGPHRMRLAFHLGPQVRAQLRPGRIELTWSTGAAWLDVPGSLRWSLVRGQVGEPLGWCSPAFGMLQPTATALGEGTSGLSTSVRTVLQFL